MAAEGHRPGRDGRSVLVARAVSPRPSRQNHCCHRKKYGLPDHYIGPEDSELPPCSDHLVDRGAGQATGTTDPTNLYLSETSIHRLREDDDFPLEEELPEDREGDEDRDALLPDEDDREGDEARGALRVDDEDLEGALARGALLVEPDDRDGVLLLLPTEREGVDALGDGALRLPLEVRGTTGDRLKLELLDEPVLGMTTGVLVDGTARD